MSNEELRLAQVAVRIKSHHDRASSRWHSLHKQEDRAHCRSYYQRHKPEAREHNRAYREKHKKALLVYQRQWVKDNPKKHYAYTEKWRKANPEKSRAIKRKAQATYVKKHPVRCKNINMKSKYGISLQDRQRMFQEQKGLCALCGTPLKESHQRICVDHDHETGQIRGLLHQNCNVLLGMAGDKVDRLEQAIEYLQKSQQNWKRDGNILPFRKLA